MESKKVQPDKFPSIEHGQNKNLSFIDEELDHHVIIQEKVDGSQLTIIKVDDQLLYYNKNSRCQPKGSSFVDACLQLRSDFFNEGFTYHGESISNKPKKKNDMVVYRHNTCEYLRPPRYNYIIYEIVDKNGYVLTPDETKKHLDGTGLEMVNVLYDSMHQDLKGMGIKEYIKLLLSQIEDGKLESSLGLKPEGIVLKVLNRRRENGIYTSRFKFVREVFAEANISKRDKLVDLSDAEFISQLGLIYDTPARKQKAKQHLEEKGQWKEEKYNNISTMINELDDDLLKEASEEIKDLLFVRFWPIISKQARGDVKAFLDNNSQ